VLVSDCFAAYDHRALAKWLKQKCFAHFLHELSKLSQEKKRGAVRFPRELLAILREALKLKEKKPRLSEAEFQVCFQELEEQLDALIAERRRFSDPDNARLAKKQQGQDPLDYLAKVLTARSKLPSLALQRSPPAVEPA
jgi:hypothetical protein